MHIQALTKENLNAADIEVIFDELVPPHLKEQVIKHAQWLDGDPELDGINAFEEIAEIFPNWPYQLKAYAYKFKNPVNEIISNLSIPAEEKNIAWINLIKIFAILGPKYIST